MVPAGTDPEWCKGKDCNKPIYWIGHTRTEKDKKTGGEKTRRVLMPVDCHVEGGELPNAHADGKGVNHYTTCPNAGDFSKRKKARRS